MGLPAGREVGDQPQHLRPTVAQVLPVRESNKEGRPAGPPADCAAMERLFFISCLIILPLPEKSSAGYSCVGGHLNFPFLCVKISLAAFRPLF